MSAVAVSLEDAARGKGDEDEEMRRRIMSLAVTESDDQLVCRIQEQEHKAV